MTSVGLTIPLSALRVNAQRYTGLPLDLQNSQATTKTMTVSLKEKPNENVAISFTIKGADGQREGWLYINGQRVASLFAWYSNPANKNRISTVRLVTPAEVWKAGVNDVTFVRRGGDGFKVLAANTWESDSQTHFSGISRGASRITARKPVKKQSTYRLNQAPRTGRVNAGRGRTLSAQDLVEAVTKPHDVPLPSVPQQYASGKYPQPSVSVQPDRLDSRLPSGADYLSARSHIDSLQQNPSANVKVEMGSLFASFYKDGQWHTTELGAPCRGYTFEYPDISSGKDTDVAACENGITTAGVGLNGWNDPSRHVLGWAHNGRVRIDSENVEHLMVWSSARTQPIDPNKPADLSGRHYQYGVGGDYLTAQAGTAHTAAVHGRRKVLNESWQVLVGHNLSPETVQRMCKQGNLPPNLPLVGGCGQNAGGSFRSKQADSSRISPPSTPSPLKGRGGPQPKREVTFVPPTPATLDPVLYWSGLVSQLTQRHDGAPIPSAPSSYCWAWNGIPSYLKHPSTPNCDERNKRAERVPDSFERRGNLFNVWTHVDMLPSSSPSNIAVQFGPTKMAIFRNGKWSVRDFDSSCKGYLFEVGVTDKRAGRAASCDAGKYATVGLGVKDWNSPKKQYHGWPGGNWNVGDADVDQVLVYAPARLVKVDPNRPADFANSPYTVALGADSRSASDLNSGKVKLTAITHGRHQKLRTDGGWTALAAHTMSETTMSELCRSGNLPPGIPFEKNCNVPGS